MNALEKSIRNSVTSALLGVLFFLPIGFFVLELDKTRWIDVTIVALISVPVLFIYHGSMLVLGHRVSSQHANPVEPAAASASDVAPFPAVDSSTLSSEASQEHHTASAPRKLGQLL
jgi:ABC-type Fe3+ transport system permease subunit